MTIKSFAFYTLGCKLNQAETAALSNEAQRRGFSIEHFQNGADVMVVNSCTLTNRADRKTRQAVFQARRRNPNAVIVLCGCLPQVQTDRENTLQAESDIVLGNRDKYSLFDALDQFMKFNEKIVCVTPNESFSRDKLQNTFIAAPERTRAFLKIQEGCENFCTYCIVPYARGPRVSRDFYNTISEAKHLAELGFREIVLTGIDIGSYNDGGKHLDDVVLALEKIENLQRIRISSIEMNTLSENLIRRMGQSQKIMPHIHLSLQSGSDPILKAMKRKYTTADFAEKMEEIRKYVPQVSVGTDVITGFPGESDRHFQETEDFIRAMKFSYLHVFRYSPRKGTPAAVMEGQIDEAVKKDRAKHLGRLDSELNKNYSKQFAGTQQPVLWETFNKGKITGYTPHYLKISRPDLIDKSGTIENIVVDLKYAVR